MLADEDWPLEEEDEIDNGLSDLISASPNSDKTMTYDEFSQKASEMIEQVENELAETKEILAVSPGSEAEYDVSNRDSSLSPVSLPTRPKVMDEPGPLYDQTRLDGISQLWGAPPEVLERNMDDDDDSERYLINDGIDFKNVYSLWGEGVPSGTASSDEEESATSSPSMDGFSQLWNENLSPYKAGDEDDDSVDQVDSLERTNNDRKAYAGLEWWDEVSEDGSYKSLSQMLAEEEYEEKMDEEDETPMTFEQFAEETEKLIEQAEDERKETEAIMNAPPNADFLEGDEDFDSSAVEKSVVASDKFKEMIMSLADGNEEEENAEESISDEEIGVLEMDDFPEDEEGSSLSIDADDEKVEEGSLLPSVFESEENVEPINEPKD